MSFYLYRFLVHSKRIGIGISNSLASRLFVPSFLLLSLLLASCQNARKAQEIPSTFQSDSLVNKYVKTILHLKSQLDSARNPIPTDTANICYAEANLDAEQITVILALGKNDSGQASNQPATLRSQTPKPCLESSIDVYPHDQVTRIQFSKDSAVLIVGYSMHDSVGAVDAAVVKFGPMDYAFTQNHICGAIQIEYRKNRMNPHDILLARGLEDTWHSFANESELHQQIKENLVRP